MPPDEPIPEPSTQSVGSDRGGSFTIAQFRLRVLQGPDAGLTFETRGERTVIGSHDAADLRLTDPTVSRFHCEIAVGTTGAVIKDLESRNATVVNGVSVLAAHLRAGLRAHARQDPAALRGRRQRRPSSGVERASGSARWSAGRARPATMFATLERAAASDATVLLQGETGTGKDAAAGLDPPGECAARWSVRRRRLRLDPAEPDRERAVRSPRGAFTGARVRPRGRARVRVRGHAVPRRDRRAPARSPAEAAARARASRGPAGRRGPSTSRSTSGSSPRRTAICAPRSTPAGFARTCSTGSRCSTSRSRRCASAKRISRC